MTDNFEKLKNLDVSSLKKNFRHLFKGVFEVSDPAVVNEQLKNIRKVYREKVNPEA